jgi:hypothetical protein
MQPVYEVIVGNLGKVYIGDVPIESLGWFYHFRFGSKTPDNDVTGQNVALLQDGECIRSYNPVPKGWDSVYS